MTVVLFPGPVFDEPVVLSSLRTVADQQHRVAQIVRVTVGLLIYSWGRQLGFMNKSWEHSNRNRKLSVNRTTVVQRVVTCNLPVLN